MQIELTTEDLKRYIQKAGLELTASIAMDGFRAGKVPLEVLRRKVGDEKILEIAMDLAVKDSFFQAVKKEKLDVVSSFDLKVTENTAQKLKYGVRLLLFPEIKLGEYQNLGITPQPVEIKEEEIREALEYIRRSRATYQEAEGPAETGQKLEIDFEVKNGGKAIEGGKSENHPLTLGEGSFIPGFEEELRGMKRGDTKSFFLHAPEDYYQKSIAGKKLDFTVILKSQKAVLLPELNDEFAKSLGNFSSAEVLKRDITQGLKKEKEQKEQERVRLQILDKISEKTIMEVPAQMVEEQLDVMVANFDQSLHERGLELSLYLTQTKKTEGDLRKEWRKKAERQIRHGLIMRAISKVEDITISDEEVNEAVTGLLSRYVGSEEERGKLNLEEVKRRAKESLLNEKVLEYLERVNA